MGKQASGTGRAQYTGIHRRGKTWHVRVDPLTGKARSLGTANRREAEAIVAKRTELAADPVRSTSASKTVEDLIREYLSRFEERVKAGKRSPGTLNFYEVKLAHWATLYGETTLAEVGVDHLDEYAMKRRGQGASDRNLAKEVATLKRALLLAKRIGWWRGDLDIMQPDGLEGGYEPGSRVLSPEEVTLVMNSLPAHQAAFVALCVGLGCRRSEAFLVQPSGIKGGIAHIPGTKTRRANRYVPVLPAFEPLVSRALPYLPLAKWPTLNKALAELAVELKLTHFSPNDLRRTHATLLEEMGATTDQIGRLLGHTSGALARRTYSHPAAEALGSLLGTGLAADIVTKTRKAFGSDS